MSTIKTDTLSNVAGSKSVPMNTVVDGSAKAWVNFNGTGTVAIRAAFNVSSITDNGVGLYTINFTVAMSDANYAFSGGCRAAGANPYVVGNSATAQTVGALPIATVHNPTTSIAATDPDVVNVVVHR